MRSRSRARKRMAKRPMREFLSRCFTKGTAECAALCAVVCAGVALSLIALGIWKTLLIALCVSMGAFIGGVKDKKEFIRKVAERFGTGR